MVQGYIDINLNETQDIHVVLDWYIFLLFLLIQRSGKQKNCQQSDEINPARTFKDTKVKKKK